jgi:16S rRNA (guanine527-N7)-methyltransferase
LTVEVEAEPAVAAQIFGEHIDRARLFTANLAMFGEERGLIGPLEPPRLWSRHILNCGVFADLLPSGALVGDVGSGAGLPGLVLAIARPDVHFALIEPMERRTEWLSEQVEQLGLTNVTVVRSRVQDAPYQEKCDVVTARAVSALKTLIPMTAPLVKPGGQLLLMKGASVDREIEDAKKQIRAHGLTGLTVIHAGEGLLEEPTRLVQATVE